MTVWCPMEQWTLMKGNSWSEKIYELCEKQEQWAQMKTKTEEDQGKQVNWLHILRLKPEL